MMPKNWKDISFEVKQKAGWKCQCCGAAHEEPHPITGSKVILTTHHIDFNPENNEPENLLACCQRCHNSLDREHRKETRRRTKDLERPGTVKDLFKEES